MYFARIEAAWLTSASVHLDEATRGTPKTVAFLGKFVIPDLVTLKVTLLEHEANAWDANPSSRNNRKQNIFLPGPISEKALD